MLAMSTDQAYAADYWREAFDGMVAENNRMHPTWRTDLPKDFERWYFVKLKGQAGYSMAYVERRDIGSDTEYGATARTDNSVYDEDEIEAYAGPIPEPMPYKSTT